MHRSLLLSCLILSIAAPSFADTPPPATDGKGKLKPGQAVGVRKCLGAIGDVNIEATSKRTVGVATCKGELGKMFIGEKKMCEGKAKRTKVTFTFSFGEGENATTGDGFFLCP